MTIKSDIAASLAVDMKGVQDLRAQLKSDPQAGVKTAAQEFEALFLQQVMKSMRATTSQDGLMDNDSTRFFTGMLDQQMAQDLSRSGSLGLAQMLEAQLSQRLAGTTGTGSESTASISAGLPADLPLTMPKGTGSSSGIQGSVGRAAALKEYMASGTAVAGDTVAPQTPKEFVEQVWPHAVEASRNTGIPPQFLVAHAALESGWGKRDIRNADGSASHNLFGIKAGKSWQGDTTDVLTTEYTDGVAQKQTETFRSYGSYGEAFQDYANLLRDNPRYGQVIGSQDGTEFARRLQQAGYATDPKYAEKLSSIINGSTLRQALTG